MFNKRFTYWIILPALLLLPILSVQAESWGSSANPRETIFLYTDRDLYVAGEEVFFDLSLFAEPAVPGRTSKFAYLALRNEHGVIKRLTVQLDRQEANGNLYLPDTLSSGYYELIAFTNWMRNAGEEWYFSKPLFIANRFDTTLESLFPPATASPLLRFIPQGGYLVSGVENRVLVLAEGSFDASLRRVMILSDSGDTLALTQLNEYGWGSFTFTPQSGLHYTVSIEGSDETFPLPGASPFGAAIQVDKLNQGLAITLRTPAENGLSGKLQLEQNGELIKEIYLQGAPDTPISIQIADRELPKGLFLLKVRGAQGEELARRFWYHDTEDDNLSFVINEQFPKRGKIALEIQNSRQSPLTDLNVSIARRNAFQHNGLDLKGWQTAMVLANALQIEPQKALVTFGELNLAAINQRLAGISGTGEFVFNEAPDRNAFFMETGELIVSGKVTQSLDGKPLAGVRVILNVPDTLVNLRYTRTNAQGEFQFLLDGYYNNRELAFTPDPETYNGLIDIEIFDKFVFEKPFQPAWFADLAAKKEYLLQAQEVVRVNKAFEISHLGPSLTPVQYVFRAPLLFANPFTSLLLDNYAPLDDLRDISRELILAWRIRQNGNQYRHVLVSANDRKQLEGSPALFVDGIITFNIEPLLELNTATIREIQIHNLEWMHGEMYFPGIIAIFTREGIWKDLDLKPRPTVVFHEAPRIPGRFVAPGHDNNNGNVHMPDLRNLMFWNSEVTARRNDTTRLEFFASDLSGEYLLTVQGIDPEGKAVHFQKVIKINP